MEGSLPLLSPSSVGAHAALLPLLAGGEGERCGGALCRLSLPLLQAQEGGERAQGERNRACRPSLPRALTPPPTPGCLHLHLAHPLLAFFTSFPLLVAIPSPPSCHPPNPTSPSPLWLLLPLPRNTPSIRLSSRGRISALPRSSVGLRHPQERRAEQGLHHQGGGGWGEGERGVARLRGARQCQRDAPLDLRARGGSLSSLQEGGDGGERSGEGEARAHL